MKVLLVDDEKLQLMRLVEAVKSVLPEAEILSFSNPVLASKNAKSTRLISPSLMLSCLN